MTADFDIGNGDRDGGDPSVFEMQIERKLDGEFQVTNGYGPLAPKVMKEHWNTFITEDDFKFMSSNGINTVRIPVGWWIASDPNPPPPYVGGSLQVLDKAFSWAQKYEMKVIVDLHAAPGSQTATTVSSSRDGFMEWGQTEKNIEDTVAIIDFLTARYAKHPSLYAVELLNEPLLPAVPLETLLRYYRAGYEAVRRHSSEAYVLFSNRLGFDPSNPIELLPLATELRGSVIDVHYYHCFMGIFKNMTLQQNIDFLYANSSVELNQLTESGALVFVGEWATEWATGNFQNPNGTTATKEEYQRFGKAELEVYGRASFGWAYWALRSAHPHFSLEWMINNGYVKLT
ncbi:probable glucan 1,3-beta-glucosidase A [Diospyros lotus]|uniref:probable glucan 1,3-beta-glucosidase A n=1 Tax=Diospyros lotus TaxID=55363 RepID=UPI0022568221|nr:probable glucan 1,3-beta-glucosidase A [Diospyros lotus]